jgi:hypothetical protein
MVGSRRWGLTVLTIGFLLSGCLAAGSVVRVERIDVKNPSSYPATIRVNQILEFQAAAVDSSGGEIESPGAANTPNWSVDNPENCRVTPREGMKVTLKGVAAGPCELTLRAKVHVGTNTVIVWSGKIEE